jgi:uncharacterized protein (DUF2164 family)
MLKKVEMLEILRTLEFDSEAMERLLDIINGVEGDMLDADTLREIKTILLEEEEKGLNEAAAEVGVEFTDDDIRSIEESYKQEVDDIRAEFDKNIQDLEEEMDKLDLANTELTHIEETIQITQITQSITTA